MQSTRDDITGYAPRHPGEYGLTVTSEPDEEPVSLALAKVHLRIDHTAEDALITAWITAARQLTESYTGRRWIEQDLVLTLERFPYLTRDIRLPVQPVSEITKISYTAADGSTAELDPDDDVQLWLDHNPPLVVPLPYQPWPITQPGALQAVTIEFTAGGDAASVPESVATAILLTLGNWDENRGDQNVISAKGLPPAARFILDSLWTGTYS